MHLTKDGDEVVFVKWKDLLYLVEAKAICNCRKDFIYQVAKDLVVDEDDIIFDTQKEH